MRLLRGAGRVVNHVALVVDHHMVLVAGIAIVDADIGGGTSRVSINPVLDASHNGAIVLLDVALTSASHLSPPERLCLRCVRTQRGLLVYRVQGANQDRCFFLKALDLYKSHIQSPTFIIKN